MDFMTVNSGVRRVRLKRQLSLTGACTSLGNSERRLGKRACLRLVALQLLHSFAWPLVTYQGARQALELV